MKVSEIISSKGGEVWSVSPENTVYEALELMAEKSVGAVMVMLDGKLIGIFSERDYARKLILHSKTSPNTLVKNVMTSHVYYVTAEQDMESCLALMNDKRIRHLPVVDKDVVTGIISMGDVVKQVIADQKYTIQQLENYISWEESY